MTEPPVSVDAQADPSGFPTEPDDVRLVARDLAARLATASGDSVHAVLLYGSHLLGARPDKHSALDFVVVVGDYRPFYEALHRAGEIHRPDWLMVGLSTVLPPNVIAFTPEEGDAGIAKCLIVSTGDLEVALGPSPVDHFLLARLVQRVALVWSADAVRAAWLEEQLAGARARVLDWVGPFLDETFDAEAVGRRLLELCYRGEFRPEARNRADAVFENQREHFRERLTPVLEAALEEGTLERTPEGFRFTTPPPASARRRWRRHFFRSKFRVTARWVKHVFTFDNWLPYITRKVERRMGVKVELTRLERRMPLIFLWPRVIRVLLTRPDREEHR